MAVMVWRAPALDEAVLANFRQKKQDPQSFTLADHPQLAGGPIRVLFEALRGQIMALDPAVTETFLKLYAAYKAEENFVSVIPQSARLKLMLNMPFADLQDAKGICRDVTNISHWATGHVELDLGTIADLPYVMGLVRQAYEWRMDEEVGS
jgi:predicted transport protein